MADPAREQLERRLCPRVAVELDVQLTRKLGGPVLGRTIDLSTGGMQITTGRPLRVDEVLHFDLVLDGESHLGGDARVMRLHPRNRYAMRFEDVTPPGPEQLSRFVALH